MCPLSFAIFPVQVGNSFRTTEVQWAGDLTGGKSSNMLDVLPGVIAGSTLCLRSCAHPLYPPFARLT